MSQLRRSIAARIPTVFRMLCTVLLFACVALYATPLQAQFVPAHWTATGQMNETHALYTATLLRSGKVLIAGGGAFSSTTAELYDPATGTFAKTGPMTISRSGHAATLLPNGNVLITGGLTMPAGAIIGAATDTAEIYDWLTGTFTKTNGNMHSARVGHTSSLLADSPSPFLSCTKCVLIAGGTDATGLTLNTTETFDSTTGTFTLTGSMTDSRASHTATWLPAAQLLLVAGGNQQLAHVTGTILSSAEVFEPVSGKFFQLSPMTTPRMRHSATLLVDGNVLVTGGQSGSPLNSAELFVIGLNNAFVGGFTAVGNMTEARENHGATLLSVNGQVLVAGGIGGPGAPLAVSQTAEIYNPATKSFSPTASMLNTRELFTLVTLPNGQVLAAGGAETSNGFTLTIFAAELYIGPSFQIIPVNLHACTEAPIVCQLSSRFPLALLAPIRGFMILAPLPRPSEKLPVRDRKFPMKYRVELGGIAGAWDVALFRTNGAEIRGQQTVSENIVTLTFNFTDAEELRVAQEESLLVFRLNAKGTPSKEYPVTARVEISESAPPKTSSKP